MASSLQMSGMISGLDTSSIITRMLSVERAPMDALMSRVSLEQQKADAIKNVRTSLTGLLNSIKNLNLRATLDVKSVGTDTPASSPTILSASAGSDAAVGTFTVKVLALATPTAVTSNGGSGASPIGDAVQANLALASAGFGITPTVGTFSVNGAQITVDSSTVLSNGTDLVGANTVFAKIRDATSGLAADKQVSVSWGLDQAGRQNKLILSATGSIQLGSGSDTSNFLTAAGLAALPAATTMTSARNLGAVGATANLNSATANLDVALSASTGTFSINGVAIAYDGATDTLNGLISRINSSAANVTAAYDSATDQLTLTSRNSGGSLIDLQDVSGNFLAAMKLSESNETVGQTASYLLNGEQRYSVSNTVADALPGVTLNLKKNDLSTTVTLTVSQDTSKAVSTVQSFLSQYNSVMGTIRDLTAYDATQKKGGLLIGDPTIRSIQNSLAMMVTGSGDGLSSGARSLSDVGISTGAVGTTVGQTKDLVLDASKLIAKLQSNPVAVTDLFGALGKSVTLNAGGTGSILSISGAPDLHTSGVYSIVSDGLGTLDMTFTPAGGGSATTSTGLIQAGQNNTSLIPGVMLTAKGALAAGTDIITVVFNPKGVGTKLADYLQGLTSTGGALSSNVDAEGKRIDEMNKSITRMQQRLDDKQAALEARFAALETALARLQNQGSALSAQLTKLSGS